MAVKIRLRAQGCKNRPHYRIVAVDSRSPRDGKYLEALGWYNPLQKGDLKVALQDERIMHWMQEGAQMTERVTSLVKEASPELLKGILLMKEEKKKKQLLKRKKK